MQSANDLVAALRDAAQPLSGASNDYDGLLELIGDARLAPLGEASHGTHEFYRERAEITKRLIDEKGFTAVAVEADWPDAYRVNSYVRGAGNDSDANAALACLDKVDPEAARRARGRYGCFDHFGDEAQQYGYATTYGYAESCERAVV